MDPDISTSIEHNTDIRIQQEGNREIFLELKTQILLWCIPQSAKQDQKNDDQKNHHVLDNITTTIIKKKF